MEVWLDVLDAGDDDTATAFSLVCGHARTVALRFLFPAMRMGAQQLFALDVHVSLVRAASKPTPFDFTSHARVICMTGDLQPIPSIVARTFPALTALSLVFRPVDRGFEYTAWDDFSTAFISLSELSALSALRFLSIYVFVAHTRGVDVLNVAPLRALTLIQTLTCLNLRISGGIDITAVEDIELPLTLKQVRLTVEMFYIVDKSMWYRLRNFIRFVEIEDYRSFSQLHRGSAREAGDMFSSALWSAAPMWSAHLSTLRLLDVRINCAALFALGLLSALTRLDFHPSDVRLSVEEEVLLQAQTVPRPASERTHHPSRMDMLGPLAGNVALSDWNALQLVVKPLTYLLPRLTRLRLLHFGMADDLWGTPPRIPSEVQGAHVNLLSQLAPFIPRSLSLWQLGDRDLNANAIYIHLPTCGLAKQAHSKS